MRIHILGICGTFMAGVAVLAKAKGFEVSGCDEHVYPPMSDVLQRAGITVTQGYDPAQLDPRPDYILIGNAMKRGNPLVEYILNQGLPYTSGPQWLAEHILVDRWVLAVAGTHGKTTTASMLAWILTHAGLEPGFLIGGVARNFERSADLGAAPFFVIEADEYDSAFFDKRSKFIHYHPRTLIINNLEFDHADIFTDLAAIQTQFHHLIRTVAQQGLIIHPQNEPAIQDTLAQGCWSATQTLGNDWRADDVRADGSSFSVAYQGKTAGHVNWNLLGLHNVHNGLAAVAAAHHAGVSIEVACQALDQFKSVKRRLEVRGQCQGITVYDDFAHHPTAIATTLHGLRQRVGPQARIIACLECASYTMRAGVHGERLLDSLAEANEIIVQQPQVDEMSELFNRCEQASVFRDVDAIVASLAPRLQHGDHVLIMSNRGFDGIHDKLLSTIDSQALATTNQTAM